MTNTTHLPEMIKKQSRLSNHWLNFCCEYLNNKPSSMKKLIILVLLIAAFISCEKIGDLKFSEAIPGGCALDKGESAKGSQIIGNNGVTYSVLNGNLELLAGFNATCCGEYSTSSDIKGDSIIIKILNAKIGNCDCICYYTYNFKFIGTGENFKYRVSVDNYLTFKGEIKP